jgi:ribosomal protein S25
MPTVTDDGITENELLDSIAAEMRGVELQPGDITAKMLSDRSGCTVSAARHKLMVLERQGVIVYVGMHRAGQWWEKVYRKA